MAELVVIGFEDEHKAEEVRLTLLRLQREYLIDLEDTQCNFYDTIFWYYFSCLMK